MDVKGVAQALDAAAMNGKAVNQFSTNESYDLKQAYEIQSHSIGLRLARGEQLIGYKMGFTSKAKMEQMGVHELIFGRLTDAMQFQDAATVDMDKMIHPRAEPEIAFRISQDISEPLTLENASSYVDSVAVALEIIDSRYENFKFSLEDVVADNCSSIGFALGPWLPVETNIKNILMSMVNLDVIISKGNSDAILGNPWESLVEASRTALKYNSEIKKGHIVLAGAATAAVHLKKGMVLSAHAEGLGSVSLDVE